MCQYEYPIGNRENIKHLIGIDADTFEQLLENIKKIYHERRKEQLIQNKRKRKRAIGAGRKQAIPLFFRTLAILIYIRLDIPQRAVSAIVPQVSQSRISLDLRILQPILTEALPVPQIWEFEEDTQQLQSHETLSSEDLPQREVIIDGMEQPVYRSQDYDTQKEYYSGKKKQHTLKTQFVTDTEHEIKAISLAVPGKIHDKKLAQKLETVKRLPDETELIGDKAYQGLAKSVEKMEVTFDDRKKRITTELPRVKILTPFKKPKGKELCEKKKSLNQAISSVRVRVEHSIGWVKNFKMFRYQFRCDHSVYTPLLQLVCGFVNLQTQRWKNEKEKKNQKVRENSLL